MCMNTSLNVLERLNPLRFIGIALYPGFTQGDNSAIEKLDHLQPPLNKNSRPCDFDFRIA